MAAIITGSIPSQNFELIRDRIGAVLAVELANQHTLNPAYPNISQVWIERFIPFNSETQMPTINVNVDRGDYSNKNQKKADGAYIFNIDIYTSAETDPTQAADQKAMITMSKIAGMVRAILSNPAYNRLLFPAGIIIHTMVERFMPSDQSTVVDALCSSIGRVQFLVQCVENVDLFAAYTPLERATTQIFLRSGDEGIYITVDANDTYYTEGGEYPYGFDGSENQGFYYEYIIPQ